MFAEAMTSKPAPSTFRPSPLAPLRLAPVQLTRGPKPRGAPAAPPTPAPRLVATHRRNQATESICGEFQRIIDWNLVGLLGPGLIVQKVEKRIVALNLATGKHMTPAEIDLYVRPSGGETRLAGWMTYWEAWVVPANRSKPAFGDSFSLASIVNQLGASQSQNTTKGSFEMIGKASYYSTPNLPSHFGFRRGVTTNPANGLPWSLTPPTGLPPRSGGPVIHTVKVEWDSTKQDPKQRGWYGPTKVLMNRII